MNDEPPLQPDEAKPRGSARRKGSPYPKAELLPRVLARAFDLILAVVVGALLGAPGALIGLFYLLVADGILHGQSPGKKIFGIKVVHVPTRREAGYRESALRNAPFALVISFLLVPLLGWFLFFTLGLAIFAFETYMIRTDTLGIRIGDVFADTQVVDTKVFAAEAARPVLLKPVAVNGAPDTARQITEAA